MISDITFFDDGVCHPAERLTLCPFCFDKSCETAIVRRGTAANNSKHIYSSLQLFKMMTTKWILQVNISSQC